MPSSSSLCCFNTAYRQKRIPCAPLLLLVAPILSVQDQVVSPQRAGTVSNPATVMEITIFSSPTADYIVRGHFPGVFARPVD